MFCIRAACLIFMNNLLYLPQVLVVDASAGSGKTRALAKHYLRLLFTSPKGVAVMGNILAVTFTNKAAQEMKERIIAFIKQIAFGQFPREELVDICPGDPKAARRKALEAMEYIVQNYDMFQVQTIDSFIKKILTGAAYRLNLSANFSIKEEYEEYLAYGLDSYIDEAAGNEKIRLDIDNFLKQYLYLENKESWLPRGDMLRLVQSMYRQAGRYGKKFAQYDLKVNLFEEKKKTLLLLKTLRARLPEGTKKRFVDVIDKLLAGGARQMEFKQMRGNKSLQADNILMNKGYGAPAVLNTKWREIKECFSSIAEKEARSLFNCYIDMFNFAYRGFQEYARKDDVLFLDELNRQARLLVDENNLTVPELYYRLAARYRHYLIDEFQDTNALQWSNLFMLVEDALASGGSLFYVGDKKQAIFRFRGGDTALFDGVKEQFSRYKTDTRMLQCNYRSVRQIVEFNNTVFSPVNLRRFLEEQNPENDRLKTLTENDITDITGHFNDSEQKVYQAGQAGCVVVETVKGKDRQEREELIKNKFLALIKKVKERVPPAEIAVLCRENKQVELVSGWLLEADIKVESEKTLNIKNNRFIKELVSFLRFLNSPIDNLSFISFICGEIFRRASGMEKGEVEEFILQYRNSLKKDKGFYLYREFRSRYQDIWNTVIETFFKGVGFVRLYELMVNILRKLEVIERFPGSYGFIARFLELIKEKEDEHQGIDDFLEWFTCVASQDLYLECSAGSAVKVFSIHKAKGLGFGVVIIPFLAMETNVLTKGSGRGEPSYTVCQHDDYLSLVRLDTKYAEFSPYIRGIYRDEYKKSLIDELNTVYVSFTRARNELYIFIPQGKGRDGNIGGLLIPGSYPDRGLNRSPVISSPNGEETILIPPPLYQNWIEFLQEEFDDPEIIRNREAIKRGEVIHRIFSEIGNLKGKDTGLAVASAVDAARAQFPHYSDFAGLEKMVLNIVSKTDLRRFFFIDKGLVYKEKDMVDGKGSTKRVDRMIISGKEVWIIDYKTGSPAAGRYRGQMLSYMAPAKEIYSGKRVRAFILFVEHGRIEEVHE